MASLLLLKHCHINPVDLQNGFVARSFLYIHPKARLPLVQDVACHVMPGDNVCVFECISDMMHSEYIPPETNILSVHRVLDESGFSPGDGLVIIFLDGSSPSEPVLQRRYPTTNDHIIVLGVHANGQVRSISQPSFPSVLKFFKSEST
ncbi:hypothetical protein F5880DRAFT_1618274 [Lentinula raphanica]|nr:hypothetical protein F5880DRAFT_1618274 [Lentinula raphanica]